MSEYYLDGPRDYNGGVDQIWGREVFVIRQTRFKGTPHPHDVMAVGSPEELKEMATNAGWDVDFSPTWYAVVAVEGERHLAIEKLDNWVSAVANAVLHSDKCWKNYDKIYVRENPSGKIIYDSTDPKITAMLKEHYDHLTAILKEHYDHL